MGAFEYVALDRQGKTRKGLLEGDTAKAVRAQLREKELLPVEVTEVAQRAQRKSIGRKPRTQTRPRLTAVDLSLITRQLATLVRAGMPVDEALQAIGEESEQPRIQRVVLGVRAGVMEGNTLASSLAAFPRAFPEIYLATVAAGEQSGHLEAVLERLADYTEERQNLQQRISHALVYPILLTVVAISIIIFLLAVMMPKVVSVYADMNQELPGLTQALISLSQFITGHGVSLLVAIVLASVIGARLWRRPTIRPRMHRSLLRLPIVGHLIRGANTARFTRTFSILTASGVPVLEALRIAGEVINNLPMKESVAKAAARVREGEPIARSLNYDKLFPPIMIHLIRSGEASGQLEQMLARAATNQERELSSTISTLLAIMEPALILFMAVVVLIIVLATLLPIMNLNQLLG